jgi:transcriptional regulator with XRE-family HTH domain
MGQLTNIRGGMIENPIAERIQHLLDERNESRSSLAEGSGVAYDRVRNWFKRATSKPNAEDLLKLAAYLGTTPEYLISGVAAPDLNSPLRLEASRQLDLLSEQELRILLAGLRLTTADRQ